VVVAAVAAWLILQERQRNARLTEELSAAQIQLEDQAEQMEAARETFARYRTELRDARTQMVGQHDEIKGTRRTAQARLEAMWALVRLEQHRNWRLTLAPPAAGWSDTVPEVPVDLTGVLTMEVERIREEVGTPGSLEASVSDLRPEDAVLCVSATRELLRVLTLHTTAYEVSVWTKPGQLIVEVICIGWEGEEGVLADAAGIREAISDVGGDLRLEPTRRSRLRATLSLPLSQ
jgi:hypothetical protein